MQHETKIWPVVMLCALALWLGGGPSAAAEDEWTPLYSPGEQARNLVVWITGGSFTDGAGVVFHAEGNDVWAMTARHVVRSGGQTLHGLKAHFYLWPNRVFPVEVERMHHEKDLAVVRIDVRSLDLPPSEILNKLPLGLLGAAGNLQRGDSIYPLGHAADGTWLSPNRPAVFHSFDSWDPQRREGLEVIRIEHFCPPGHSGGALFDGDWRLVGMIFENSEPFCRALRIGAVMRILQGWKYRISLYEASRGDKTETALPEEEIKVAVVDFEDRSGADLPELGPAAQDVIASFLTNLPRVTVLSRDRIRTVRRELGLEGTVLGRQKISRLGKLLDAEAVVTGSVIRYDVERQEYEGFGTSALRDTYRLSISLQVIDVESGQIRFADTFDVEDQTSYLQASSAPSRPLTRETELLRKALEVASGDLQKGLTKVAMGLASGNQLVQVPVTTVPPGADVMIAGNYVGSTPIHLELEMGVHELILDHPGYRPWKRKVNVEPGVRVDVTLMRTMR